MLITRDDIQRIGDEATLLHFLEEKLNLPIPEGLSLEDITSKFSNFSLGLSGAVANQVLDCQELSVSPGEPSGIILIRFDSESGYAETLRAIAESLDRPGRNPASLRFICMNEYCQPFAFAYFNSSQSKDWQSAVLNIRAWTQENTHIHTSSEHELPTDFFPNMSTSQPVVSASPKALLAKLVSTGTPLGKDEDIHSGIGLKYKAAFVIDDATAKQLIAKDPNSAELIKTFPDKPEKWKWELKNIIYIPSSKNKEWPWSGIANEQEAERVFKKHYPAIGAHMKVYKDRLKKGKRLTLFYWEFPPSNIYDKLNRPKIIYKPICTSMQAAYDPPCESDPPCEFLCATTLFIPTTNLSLLAILNSKLFDWFARKKFRSPNLKSKQLSFTKKNMVKAPIAPRTEEQKAELSGLVQQILDNPDSPEISDIEREIDQLVYKLYKLTTAEIALIEEETNK